MTTYYKAVKPDGHSFTGEVDYLTGETIRHPNPKRGASDAYYYLSISVEPGDCTGFRWPAKLLEVKPVGRPWTPHPGDLPNKRAVTAVTVVKELDAHLLFGPQGEVLVAMLDLASTFKRKTWDALYTARNALGQPWWDSYAVADGGRADRAGLRAARFALYGRLAGWSDVSAACGAALAVLMRHTIGTADGITQVQYDLLTQPWVKVTGQKAHPEDVVF